VYDLSSSTPELPVARLNNPTPGTRDYFGATIAIKGITVAVGAPRDDTTAVDKGAAYVFAPANPDFDGDGLLDIWEFAYFGTTTGHGALDDSDSDGRRELLELAFDTDPTSADADAAPVVVTEGGYLTLTLTKRAGVTYLAQSAADLAGAAFSAATTQVLLNSATTLKVRDSFPLGTAPQRFLRVQVAAAP
jgi:hypothetical protein